MDGKEKDPFEYDRNDPFLGGDPVTHWMDQQRKRIADWREQQQNKPKTDDGRGFDSPLYDAGEQLFKAIAPGLAPIGEAAQQVRQFVSDNKDVPGIEQVDFVLSNFADWGEIIGGRSEMGLQRGQDAIEANTNIRLDDRGPAVGGAVTAALAEEVATAAIPTALGKLDEITPPPAPVRELAPAAAVATSARGRIRYNPQLPDNVMQINANVEGAFGKTGLKTTEMAGEGLQARRSQLVELGESNMPTTEAQRRRIQRAIWSTNYMISNPRAWARDATQAAKMKINWHHVGDLALTGDVGIALEGTDKFPKVMELINKKYLKRTGNDSINAMLVPMGFDHQGLIHQKYYPKLSSRVNLEKVVKSGEIKNWSPKRIAAYLNVVLEDQQEVVIGWAKWKTDQIKKAYPELKTAAQIKEFVYNNGDLIREIGKGEEILDVDQLRKFGAPSGAVRNTSNKQIREIWGINFGSQAAQRGLEHTIPGQYRLRADNTMGSY